MRNKTICNQIFKKQGTSLKFQLPEVTISIINSHHAYQTSQLPFKWNRWWGNWNNICKHPLSAAYIVMPVVRLEHTRTILQIWPAGTHRPKMHVKAGCCHIGPSIKNAKIHDNRFGLLALFCDNSVPNGFPEPIFCTRVVKKMVDLTLQSFQYRRVQSLTSLTLNPPVLENSVPHILCNWWANI